MNDLEAVRKKWSAERADHEKFGDLLTVRLTTVLRPCGIWSNISARAKEVDSLIKKLFLKDSYSFETIPDKVGVRIVVRYLSDIPQVVEAIQSRFEFVKADDKREVLGVDRVGYQSVHLDNFRLLPDDQDAGQYPPDIYWAELQVRTLAQHLWSEISHDTAYKNPETTTELTPDLRRRVHLMAGQIEVADREFERIRNEQSDIGILSVLGVLEKYYYRLTSRRPDSELSFEVLRNLMPLYENDTKKASGLLEAFLEVQGDQLARVYAQADELGSENRAAFLYQPEVLMMLERLRADPSSIQRTWNERYPAVELERIANVFGVSFD